MRRALTIAAATAGLAGTAAAAPAASGPERPQARASRMAEVVLRDVDYHPRTTRIHRGDRVRWLWRDPLEDHSVTSNGSPRFRSASVRDHGSWTVRFRRKGTYRYHCTIHLNMEGRVIVR